MALLRREASAYMRFERSSNNQNLQPTVVLRNKVWTKYQRQLKFNANQQTWRLFLKRLPGLALTIALLTAIMVTLVIYQRRGPVDNGARYAFLVITLGLIIGLSLNFIEVFRDMAKVARWRILSSRQWTIREVDLILGSESLMKTLTLMLESRRRPKMAIACGAWLLLTLLAQVILAIQGALYSLERGNDSSGITLAPGNISVPRLDCYHKVPVGCPDTRPQFQPTLSHAYGEAGVLQQRNCNYTTDEDIFAGDQNCPYFARADRQEFAVRFIDFDPDDANNAYPHLQTGRVLHVAAGNCTVQRPPFPKAGSDADGVDGSWQWEWKDAAAPGGNLTLAIPRTASAALSTTYVWNGTSLPHWDAVQPSPFDGSNDTSQQCGPRCATLFAVRNMFRDNDAQRAEYTLFRCPVTVSAISGAASTGPLQLPDATARTAAASIALAGRWRPLPGGALDWRQYQLYQFGSPWAADIDDPAAAVGARMAEFAAASLAGLAARNPRTEVPTAAGRPRLGYAAEVHWRWLVLASAGIAGTHALLVALLLALARPVVVAADSCLVSARLLRDLVANVPGDRMDYFVDARGLASEIARSIADKGPREDEPEGDDDNIELLQERRGRLR